MNQYKIIVTGPVGAGKTTAIKTVSNIPTVTTDAVPSDMTRKQKSSTTVAMDYGTMNSEKGDKIHLYGTPGQERFDFMWDIISEGGKGLILLLDNTRADPFKDMNFFLDSFAGFISDTSIAIGVTQMDLSANPTINDYHQQLQNTRIKPPVFAIDARVKNDVAILVQTLLLTLNPDM